jgi:arylsulfatase A
MQLHYWLVLIIGAACSVKPTHQPNFVILLADNLGYEDVSWFAAQKHKRTPHIDSLGRDGLTFTNWNSAAHLCSASRAALVTGLYPARTGIYPGVFQPDAALGLRHKTIASYLQEEFGFATAIVGKWHLGHLPEFLPTSVGFDEWLGIPYHMSGGSIDNHTCIYDTHRLQWLPLYQNTEIVQQPVQVQQLAKRYAAAASRFIRTHAKNDQPFFLYVPFSHVHQLCASATLPEQSVCQWAAERSSLNRTATFADALQEMDWIVGQVLQTLDETGTANNTLVLFTSDNGPWVAEQSCSGLKGPFQGQWLREHVPIDCTACPHDYRPNPSKDRPRQCTPARSTIDDVKLTVDGVHCGDDTGLGSVWEANLRMPSMIRWPDRITGGRSTDTLVSTLDVVPTFLSLLGRVSMENEFDGLDISDLIVLAHQLDNSTTTRAISERVLFFWRDGFLRDISPLGPPYGRFDVVAVKIGRIKAWFSTKSAHYNGDLETIHDIPLLFDVIADPAEAHPLPPPSPEFVAMLKQLIDNHKHDIANSQTAYPLTLDRDPRFIPCANPVTGCRVDSAEASSSHLLVSA